MLIFCNPVFIVRMRPFVNASAAYGYAGNTQRHGQVCIGGRGVPARFDAQRRKGRLRIGDQRGVGGIRARRSLSKVLYLDCQQPALFLTSILVGKRCVNSGSQDSIEGGQTVCIRRSQVDFKRAVSWYHVDTKAAV